MASALLENYNRVTFLFHKTVITLGKMTVKYHNMKFIFSIVLFTCCTFFGIAQKISVQEYIDTYKEFAIKEMKRSGVPADITLAQGVLETENGNSILVKKSNNHFGIKCKETWTGESVYHDDDALGECFRKYNTAEESYRDHSDFLRTRKHYSFLFNLDPTDYKGWAYGLKKAGYATNPNYPKILIKTIEDYNLNQITKDALNDIPVHQDFVIKDTAIKKEVPPSIVEKTITKIKDAFETKSSITKFNGLKAVYVDSGTSLLAIATNYSIPLVSLLDYNDLKADGILTNKSLIYLERKHSQGRTETYTTIKTESIYDIAQANGVQLASLLEYNHLKENAILKPKTLLILRSNNEVAVTQKSADVIFHEVQPKEGLYSISKKYNVTVKDIKSWNNLLSDDVSIGQKLIISK